MKFVERYEIGSVRNNRSYADLAVIRDSSSVKLELYLSGGGYAVLSASEAKSLASAAEEMSAQLTSLKSRISDYIELTASAGGVAFKLRIVTRKREIEQAPTSSHSVDYFCVEFEGRSTGLEVENLSQLHKLLLEGVRKLRDVEREPALGPE